MTGFVIGMIAAGVWIVAAVGLWFFLKRSPKHPFRSIREFRQAGRKLAEPIHYEPDPSIRLVDASEAESPPSEVPVTEDQLELFVPPPPTNEQDEFVREASSMDDAELEEINEVIEAVTSEQAPPRPKRNSQSPRKRTAAMNKPVRKIGKLTYVVVDEEGKPEANPR